MPLFLLLCVVLLVFSVFAEFKFTSLNHKIRRCFEAMRIKEDSKKRPKMTKYGWSKARPVVQSEAPKRSVREAGERSEQEPPRAARGGRMVVLPRMHDRPPPLLSSGFVFLHALSSSHVICGFCLQDECIWLILHRQFLSFHHSSSSFILE